MLAWHEAAEVTEYVVVLRMTGRVDEPSKAESSAFVLRPQVEGDVAGSVHVCRSDVFRFRHASPYRDAQGGPVLAEVRVPRVRVGVSPEVAGRALRIRLLLPRNTGLRFVRGQVAGISVPGVVEGRRRRACWCRCGIQAVRSFVQH